MNATLCTLVFFDLGVVSGVVASSIGMSEAEAEAEEEAGVGLGLGVVSS